MVIISKRSVGVDLAKKEKEKKRSVGVGDYKAQTKAK